MAAARMRVLVTRRGPADASEGGHTDQAIEVGINFVASKVAVGGYPVDRKLMEIAAQGEIAGLSGLHVCHPGLMARVHVSAEETALLDFVSFLLWCRPRADCMQRRVCLLALPIFIISSG